MNDREVPTEDDNGRTPVGAVRAGCPGRHGLGTSPSATCFSVDVVGGLSVAPASSWAPTRETVAALVGQYYLCALWIPTRYHGTWRAFDRRNYGNGGLPRAPGCPPLQGIPTCVRGTAYPGSESRTRFRNSDAHKTSLPKSGRLRSEFGEVLYTLCP